MTDMKPVNEVFDQWEKEGKGDKMAWVHWPRVSPILVGFAPSTGNYLEIGTGTGIALEYVAKNPFFGGQCYGLDVSNEMILKCHKRFAGVRNVIVENDDFLAWKPPARKRFNIIFSMEVFYYFPDIQLGLDKAFKLLKKKGELWVLVNFYKENEASHDWPENVGTSMHLWSKKQYANGFRKAGFDVVEQKFIGGDDNRDGVTLCTYGKKS
jgi:SAM-dependent methyltransferase